MKESQVYFIQFFSSNKMCIYMCVTIYDEFVLASCNLDRIVVIVLHILVTIM